MGLSRAGFEVEGWDISLMPNYPFRFHHGNALDADLKGFDLVWASPPCQKHSKLNRAIQRDYECFIERTREKIKRWGGPYIIENVVGAPLENPLMLCGGMFGLETYRHRIFESNMFLIAPTHNKHIIPGSRAGHYIPGTFISVCGNCAPIDIAKKAMGIDWMTRIQLTESIPPIYSEFLGRQAISILLKT